MDPQKLALWLDRQTVQNPESVSWCGVNHVHEGFPVIFGCGREKGHEGKHYGYWAGPWRGMGGGEWIEWEEIDEMEDWR